MISEANPTSQGQHVCSTGDSEKIVCGHACDRSDVTHRLLTDDSSMRKHLDMCVAIRVFMHNL